MISALLQCENRVHFRGWKERPVLCSLGLGDTVALLPTQTSSFNQAHFGYKS